MYFGESGSGKRVTMRALIRLLPDNRAVLGGEVNIGGLNVGKMGSRELADLRGGQVGVIFQEPMVAFDPVYTIGHQIVETVVRHENLSYSAARARPSNFSS